jgi:hypothetical protein
LQGQPCSIAIFPENFAPPRHFLWRAFFLSLRSAPAYRPVGFCRMLYGWGRGSLPQQEHANQHNTGTLTRQKNIKYQ